MIAYLPIEAVAKTIKRGYDIRYPGSPEPRSAQATPGPHS
jgi:hypothetical protein